MFHRQTQHVPHHRQLFQSNNKTIPCTMRHALCTTKNVSFITYTILHPFHQQFIPACDYQNGDLDHTIDQGFVTKASEEARHRAVDGSHSCTYHATCDIKALGLCWMRRYPLCEIMPCSSVHVSKSQHLEASERYESLVVIQ